MAASKVTTEAMAFFVRHGTGIVCVSMKEQDLERLQIPLMVIDKANEEKLSTAFTVSVALDLGRGANPNGYVKEEIWQDLATAKYLTWEHESTKRSWKLQNLTLKQKQFFDTSDTEGFVDENAKSNLDQLEALGIVFDKVAKDDTPTEINFVVKLLGTYSMTL